MRVLWATRHLPDPNGGGGAVSEYETIRQMAGEHEIVVVSGGLGARARSPDLDAIGVEAVGVEWQRRVRPTGGPALLHRLAVGPSPLAVWEVGPCANALAAAVGALEAARRFDVVAIFPGEMAEVAARTGAPTALLLADCYTRQAERELAMSQRLRHRVMYRFEARNAARWEAEAYRAASEVACVSPVDRPVLERLAGRDIDLIPLPLGPDWFAHPTGVPDAEDVVFVGALDYRPNVDAVEWLAGDIWPRISAVRPAARLHVVGRNPVAEVRAALTAAGGELRADVDDVRPWYWRAAAVVAPIRLGSGTRNKVLHAMASGGRVVATSVACEGIDVVPGRHVLVADDAAGFAAAVLGCLDDPAAAARRAAEAQALMRGRATVGGLTRFWERAAAHRRRDGCGSSS